MCCPYQPKQKAHPVNQVSFTILKIICKLWRWLICSRFYRGEIGTFSRQ